MENDKIEMLLQQHKTEDMSTQNRNVPWFHKIEMSPLGATVVNEQRAENSGEEADGA